MGSDRAEILARLKRDILPLQGLRVPTGKASIKLGWGAVDHAFPNKSFPTGAIHEFISSGHEETASTAGFVSGILSALMHQGGVSIWISSSRMIFPPALKFFGIEPERVIFVDLQNKKDILWATEEALKCEGLSAVIAEVPELSFIASRRLQLAVEKSRVTGFLLRNSPRIVDITACVSRWKITSLPGILEEGLPGVGFPRWTAELIKIRNGIPGSWPLEWSKGKFRHLVPEVTGFLPAQKKKTG